MMTDLANAASRHPSTGFQRFAARYSGGYSIVAPTGNFAGPADIRIWSARNGLSAKITWTNTFYTTRGSYRVALRWTFLSNGTMFANTIDPRSAQMPASGTFLIDRNRPIPFSATSVTGNVHALGQLRRIGGGSISIVVTLSGLPEGDITYSFSGGRRR